jgi:hypothetical protein
MLKGMGTPRGNAGGLVLLAALLCAAVVWVATSQVGTNSVHVTGQSQTSIERVLPSRVLPSSGTRTREASVRESTARSTAEAPAQRQRVTQARPAAQARNANWQTAYPDAVPFKLSGDVLDAARRRPIENAQIEIALPGQAGLKRRVQTNAEGHFQLDWYHGVPSQLVIEHPEFVRYAALEVENQAEYALTPSGAIHGVARFPKRVSGASVKLWQLSTLRPEEWPVQVATIDDDGRFQFNDLDPGTYALCPVGEDVAGRYVTGLEVLPGATLEVEAELTPGGEVAGRVQVANPSGSPVADARLAGVEVSLLPLQVGMPSELTFAERQTQTADADGRFRFSGLRAGSYRLTTWPPWGGLHHSQVEIEQAGARVEWDLIVAPPSTLAGVVVESEGRVVAEAQVRLVGSDAVAQTDSNGRFALDEVPSGRALMLRASAHSGAGLTGSLTIAPIETNAAREAVRVVLWPELTLRGRLEAAQASGENGAWLSNATVNVEQKQGSVLLQKQQLQTDAKGEFEITGLAREATTLTFYAAGYLPDFVSVDLGDPAATLAGQTLLQLETASARCVFTLEPALVVHGVVRDEFGAALPEVFVLAKAKDQDAELPDRMTVTDALGQFRFPSLAETDWLIVPRDPNWLVVEQSPAVVLAAFVHTGGEVQLVLRRRAERTKASLHFEVVRAADGLAPKNLSLIGARDAAVSIQGGAVSITGLDPAIQNLLLVADECAVQRIQPGLVAGVESRLGVIEMETGVTLIVEVLASNKQLLRVKALPLSVEQGGPVAGTPAVDLSFDGEAYRLTGLPMGKWRLRVLGENGEIASEVLTLDQPVFEHTVEL